jgi:hypothetical protein
MNKCYLYKPTNLIALVLLLFVILPSTTKPQSREYLVKAGYIEKFTHFIEWPEKEINNDSVFKIAVIGGNNYGSNLEEIFAEVNVYNKPVRINYIKSVGDIKNSKVVVIVGTMQNQLLDQILNYTSGKPILTISEGVGYGKRGILINMVLVNNYIRFEINKRTLSKSGLKINSLLLNSAIIIDAND